MSEGPSHMPSEAAQAAQEAAARIYCQLGLNSADSTTKMPRPHAGLGKVATECYPVPEKMVGLIIGKWGTLITRLEAQSGCKMQIAADCRPCILTGTPHSIRVCKQMIQQIIDRGNQPLMDGMDSGRWPEGNSVVEMSIPVSKVGLIIGKDGETIRQLQERANVMIQDSDAPTDMDKLLRITGKPSKCQRAKEMVLELLAEKDMQGPGGGGMGTFNNFDGMHGGHDGPGDMEISVPHRAAGCIIGKGGKMIKKIQTETGAKVQFKPDDGQSEDRLCAITGSPDKVQNAISMIHELLANANNAGPDFPSQFGGGREFNVRGGGGGGGFGMGRGGGPGRGGGRSRGGPFPSGGHGRGVGGSGGPPGGSGMGQGGFGDPKFQDQTQYSVPAGKCGLVIGKGGETIRDIIRQSCAHVELDKNPPPNMAEKVFNIRGTPQQILHAVQLICDKAGIRGFPGGPMGPGPGGPGPGGPGPGGFEQFDQYGQPNQPPQQYGAPQGWNAYGNQYKQQPSDPTSVSPAINPQTGQPGYSAAWLSSTASRECTTRPT